MVAKNMDIPNYYAMAEEREFPSRYPGFNFCKHSTRFHRVSIHTHDNDTAARLRPIARPVPVLPETTEFHA